MSFYLKNVSSNLSIYKRILKKYIRHIIKFPNRVFGIGKYHFKFL